MLYPIHTRPTRSNTLDTAYVRVTLESTSEGWIQTLRQAYYSESSAMCVQGFDDSRNSAIHITYRSSLRPSSLRLPRHPWFAIVLGLIFSMVMLARLLAAGIYIPDEPEQNTHSRKKSSHAQSISKFSKWFNSKIEFEWWWVDTKCAGSFQVPTIRRVFAPLLVSLAGQERQHKFFLKLVW